LPLDKYFTLSGTPIVSSQYRDAVHGKTTIAAPEYATHCDKLHTPKTYSVRSILSENSHLKGVHYDVTDL
jgi:hypothetical protein